MIQRHEFNSRWWGGEVGIVSDDALFGLPAAERAERLAPWDWVEARGALDPRRCALVGGAGFALVDTQVRFKIGLARLAPTPSLERLDVRPATAVRAEDLADFAHERFSALPGVTSAQLNQRYANWSAELIASDPELALEVRAEGAPQGWFLSRRTDAGLELTLAMLHRDAAITGHHLYHRALLAYRETGLRVGHAAFSVTNTAVHNIYAALGARFLEPVGCWLWHPAL